MEYNLTKEPKLEEYGLDVSSYENYRKQKIDLETNFTKFKSEIEDSNPNRFGLTPYLFFAVGFLGSIFSLIYGNYTLSFIFGSLLFLGYIFESIDSASSDKNALIVNSKKAEIDKKIEFIKSKVFQFEEDCIKYYLNFCDEFYKNNIYRKHSKTDKYKKSTETLALIKAEIIAISQKTIFKHKALNVTYNDHIDCLYRHISYYKNNLNHFFNTFEKIKFSDETENELKIYLENQVGVTKTKEKNEVREITEPKKTDFTKKVVDTIIKDSENNTLNVKDKIDTNNYTLDTNRKIKEEFWRKRDEKLKQINESDFGNKDLITPEKPKEEESNIKKENVLIQEPKKKGFWASIMDEVKDEIEKSNNPTSYIDKEELKESIIDTTPIENKYRTPRKIDWDSINKTKKITGLKGEEIVLEMEKSYLNSIGRQDLSENVKHVSKDIGDGLGYDILSYFEDGQEKYIEVKSSNRANNNSFYISQNELEFMKNYKYNSVIYRIFNINENEEMPTLRVHRADDILGYKKIIPTQYLVKMD